MNENGFFLDLKHSEYVSFNTGIYLENFPIMVFKRNDTDEIKIDSLEQLKKNKLV